MSTKVVILSETAKCSIIFYYRKSFPVQLRTCGFNKSATRFTSFLESKGYVVDRSYFGSEDGEAILYRKKGSEDWHFLCHLDPMFVEIEDVEGYVKEEVGEIQ